MEKSLFSIIHLSTDLDSYIYCIRFFLSVDYIVFIFFLQNIWTVSILIRLPPHSPSNVPTLIQGVLVSKLYFYYFFLHVMLECVFQFKHQTLKFHIASEGTK